MSRILFISFLVFFSVGLVNAQDGSYGNIVKVKFDQQSVILSDTTGKWEDITYKYGYSWIQYFDHLLNAGKEYFLKRSDSYFEYTDYFRRVESLLLLEYPGSSVKKEYAKTCLGCDVIDPLALDLTRIIRTENGVWLLNGSNGKSFISNNDSMFTFYAYPNGSSFSAQLIMILGKVGDKYLGTFSKNEGLYRSSYRYKLIDLSKSPFIDSSMASAIEIQDSLKEMHGEYVSVRHIKGDMYLFETSGAVNSCFYIFRLTGDKFCYVKPVIPEFYCTRSSEYKWNIRNGKLFIYNGSSIFRFDYSSTDNSFTNKTVLISSENPKHICSDRELKYAAQIAGSELMLYDLDASSIINRISLNEVSSPSMPFIDSPYVYIHQVKCTVGVKANSEAVLKGYVVLNAYPNPFNASAKIQFSIPSDAVIELNVYDILGQKVRCLQSGFEKCGEHELSFEAGNLPSGIYFCRLESAGRVKTTKLMLMK